MRHDLREGAISSQLRYIVGVQIMIRRSLRRYESGHFLNNQCMSYSST